MKKGCIWLALFHQYPQCVHFLTWCESTENLGGEMHKWFAGDSLILSHEAHGYACEICTLLQTEFIVQLLHRLHLLPALSSGSSFPSIPKTH